MDYCNQLPLRFLSFLVTQSCNEDTLYIPLSFCAKFGEIIPPNVTVVLRNGDEIDLQFRKDTGVFVGMKKLFDRFDCRHGCILAFQFNGGNNFFLHVITSSYEIYGDIEDDAGCKFVRLILSDPIPSGRMSLPPTFIESFGEKIPSQVTICLKNGKRFVCGYDKNSKDLFAMDEIFAVTGLSLFDTILFTYHGDGLFDMSVFNKQCIEKPISNDNLLLENVDGKFEIKVQHSHLLRYCLGVCIGVRFKAVTDKWNTVDSINVYHQTFAGTLEIKKRDSKVEIHRGWVELRKYFNLKYGDICVFRKVSGDRDFQVEVLK